jgi:hypothetical protein
MPLAWAEVLLPLSFLGYWLSQRVTWPVASLLIALFGAAYIPSYEQFAFGANWWYYQHAPMLGHAPLYIIAGEFLIVLPLTFAALRLEGAKVQWVVVVGALEGLWIWLAYAGAFAAFG